MSCPNKNNWLICLSRPDPFYRSSLIVTARRFYSESHPIRLGTRTENRGFQHVRARRVHRCVFRSRSVKIRGSSVFTDGASACSGRTTGSDDCFDETAPRPDDSFPTLKSKIEKRARFMISMFCSTKTHCERTFSNIKLVLSKCRTHLSDGPSRPTTEFDPNYHDILKDHHLDRADLMWKNKVYISK